MILNLASADFIEFIIIIRFLMEGSMEVLLAEEEEAATFSFRRILTQRKSIGCP